ncbi:MAG TPA: hypothetical protein VKG82_08795 [Solirubrobacteraceae bacterium]|nr:hypothetical protein [Solirubrobacteraceae bacterium]HME02613.1 hypothetical protein [Solirubrobacteraceae bacterium]
MSTTTEQATDQATEQATAEANEHVGDVEGEATPTIAVELALPEAEALRSWLLKPTQDGATSLEDPLVSRALTKLAMAVDTVRATVNVRRELEQAGLVVGQLSDEQVRELGRRVAQAATAGIRP